MVPSLLLGCMSMPIPSAKVVLFRGADLGDATYMSVVDATLDSGESDKSKGGLFTLEGGKNKTIVIKFGDLESALPQNALITSATLYLSPSSTDQPAFRAVDRVLAPWGEGPMFTNTVGRPAEQGTPKFAASWKQRRSGFLDWQQAGASGPQDAVPIIEAKFEALDKEVAITGLGPAIQSMKNRWFENHGLALRFDQACEFFSSQAKNGKPRLEIEYITKSSDSMGDLSVQWLDRQGSGDNTTYRATIKNVGSAAAPPFQGQWSVGERPGGVFAIGKGLNPGEETQVELRKPYRKANGDARLQPVQFRVIPGAPEANSNNDAVEIHEDAITIGFDGAKLSADAIQTIIRRVNDTFFTQSRFSFAADGVLERVRAVPNQDVADFVVDLAGGPSDIEITRRILTRLTGLVSQSPEAKVVVDSREIRFDDPYPGISGFGDTRFEGLIPPGIPMLYAPVASPLFDTLPIEPTGLLSSVEVAALNTAIGKRGAARLGIPWDLPATIILRATDMTGKPLDGAELAFFPYSAGQISDTPTQTVLTKDGGTVILDSKDVSPGVLDKDAIHALKRNPFGNLRSDGSNGTFLIRAQINGEVEWSWLKYWQLTDAFHRGNRAAAFVDVRFNAPSGRLDRTVDLAAGKLVTDSANGLPAKLAAATDGKPETVVTLGSNKGDWIEIDLGRDRPIGEVEISTKGNFMAQKFDILAYATGQVAPEIGAWVKDLDQTWTRRNLGRPNGSVPYRGPTARARFIRIVNRSGGSGEISTIRVFALKVE